jgi:putative hydrolase
LTLVTSRDPVADLRRIAFHLERANEATYRVRAFRSAATAIAGMDPAELQAQADAGTLSKIKGVGDVTARCIAESLAGEEPVYLRRVEATSGTDLHGAAAELRDALRGDCHVHSDWSDGGSGIEEMALAAVELGHEYMVLTDHSPRLTVANGLTPARLRRQLDLVAKVNDQLPEGFRILTGIEVDINEDGSLDQEDALLERLDVVVASVHSKLRDESPRMTRRMLKAIANPHLDILGHMTGRKVSATGEGDRGHRGGRTRPPSDFDLDKVIAAVLEHGKAIEINCRPDRLDPPKRMLTVAVEAGCVFSIDTDAHAPGQMDWLGNGCERAALCGVDPGTVVNTWPAERLLEWTAGHK